MPLHFAENTAVLSGTVVVDEAEPLAAWLRTTTGPLADLAACAHLHTAALQALMAARVKVAAAPADDFLRAWILPLLETAPAEEARPAEETSLAGNRAEIPAEIPADIPDAVPTEHPAPEEVPS